jgi:hypothetical protein
MAPATPEQLLGHSSIIFIAHAIEIKSMDRGRSPGMRTTGGNVGRVELLLEVDEPLGYGRLRSQVTSSPELPSKGGFLKAVHYIHDVPDSKRLYGEDRGNWGLRSGSVLIVRRESERLDIEPLRQSEVELIFNDRQYIFSLMPCDDEPGHVKVWDIRERGWALRAMRAFQPLWE